MLKYIDVTADNIGRSVEETLRVLQALQTGGLCPAEWKPGKALLTVYSMALHMRSPLPSLEGVRDWINGGPVSEADLAGARRRAVLVGHVPHLPRDGGSGRGVARKYEPLGVKFVSIHQPRGPAELDVARVTADATGEMHSTPPLAIDNAHTIVDRFENEYVPAFYVFDREHKLRHVKRATRATTGSSVRSTASSPKSRRRPSSCAHRVHRSAARRSG